MTKQDKLAQMALSERASIELDLALGHLRAATTVLGQISGSLRTMAECAIVQTEALKKEVEEQ